MKRDLDFHTVHDGHLAIHDQLCNWSRVVRVHASSNRPSPMFAAYRSSEIWTQPETRIPTDMQAGWRTERAVRNLPEKHRDAVRWVYVFSWRPPGLVARRLGVSTTALQQLVHDGRAMLRNRT